MRKSIIKIILISFIFIFLIGCSSTDIKDTMVSSVSSKKYDAIKNDYIAIIPFNNNSKEKNYSLSKMFPDMIEADLAKIPEIKLINRTSLEKVFKEQELSLTGVILEDSAIKAGQLKGAKRIIIGNIYDDPYGIKVSLKIVHAETGVTEYSDFVSGKINDTTRLSKNLVYNILKYLELTGNSGLMAKIFRPVDYVDNKVGLNLLQTKYISDENKRNELVTEAFQLDPLSGSVQSYMITANQKKMYKEAVVKYNQEFYNKAKATRQFYLFYKNLYNYLETVNLPDLSSYKIEKVNYKPHESNPTNVIVNLSANIKVSKFFNYFINKLCDRFDIQKEEDNTTHAEHIILKGEAVPYLDMIYISSNIIHKWYKAQNYQIGYGFINPRDIRFGFKVYFTLCPEGATIPWDKWDTSESVSGFSVKKSKKLAYLKFSFQAGKIGFRRGSGFISGRRRGEDYKYVGLVLNYGFWDEYYGNYGKNFTKEIDVAFEYIIDRQYINNPINLLIMSGPSKFINPINKKFDMKKLFY